VILVGWALTACVPVSRPLVKIGLVAPFEGRYRDVGYEVIYAVRLAVREQNAAGGVGGYSVALQAFDDGGDPAQAIEQARKLAADPDVVGGLGHWLGTTTAAAAPAYAEAGIPMLATTSGPLPAGAWRWWLTAEAEAAVAPADALTCPPPCEALDDLDWLRDVRADAPGSNVYGPALWGQPQFLALAGAAGEGAYFVAPAPYPGESQDPSFAERYAALSQGVTPRAYAVLAYDGARLLFAAIERSLAEGDGATRAGVAEALADVRLGGLSGELGFDAAGNWLGARPWVYQWTGGSATPRGLLQPWLRRTW
jgi:ABC-type branched-subunit amino acid transport system substrate-binding protein